MTLQDMSIGRKLSGGFGACLFILLALSGTALWKLSTLNVAIDTLSDVRSPITTNMGLIDTATSDYRAAVELHIIADNPQQMREAESDIVEARKTVDSKVIELDKVLTTPEASQALASFKKEWADVTRDSGPVLAASRGNNDALAGSEFRRVLPGYSDTDAAVNNLRAVVAKENDTIQVAAQTGYDTAWYILIIGIAIAITAVVGLMMTMTKLIAKPLERMIGTVGELAAGKLDTVIPTEERKDEVGQLATAMLKFRDQLANAEASKKAQTNLICDSIGTGLDQLSQGDLTATITADLPGEFAPLKSNFNDALMKMRELIGAVAETAASIRTGSGEIAQASEDLARRTESSAASLEETAASVTQMDGRLRASAQAAARTVERADQAIATVGGGRAVADEAVEAMGRVSDSAKGIDSVIEGLDKIAFQTRVLAMNAAVEAGRAGDAGRGFAVVADLVSALAMRAEEEAKRARDQLTVTQTDIVTAVEAVTKVDGALANISGDVSQVHELLATMAADNQAQSAAITQISAAIGTMDQATQQNAAMVEETSAAARNLSSEVTGLTEQASRFNVGNSARPGVRPVAAVKSRRVDARSYASPVKPLPAAGIAALVRTSDDDWNSF